MISIQELDFRATSIRRTVDPTPTVGSHLIQVRLAQRSIAIAIASACIMAHPTGHAGAGGPQDSWTGQDKALHFGMSAPLGLLGVSFASRLGFNDPMEKKVVGALIGAMPGLVKELSDIANPRATASLKDLAFNLLGAALGASLSDCCSVSPVTRRDRLDGLTLEYRIHF